MLLCSILSYLENVTGGGGKFNTDKKVCAAALPFPMLLQAYTSLRLFSKKPEPVLFYDINDLVALQLVHASFRLEAKPFRLSTSSEICSDSSDEHCLQDANWPKFKTKDTQINNNISSFEIASIIVFIIITTQI